MSISVNKGPVSLVPVLVYYSSRGWVPHFPGDLSLKLGSLNYQPFSIFQERLLIHWVERSASRHSLRLIRLPLTPRPIPSPQVEVKLPLPPVIRIQMRLATLGFQLARLFKTSDQVSTGSKSLAMCFKRLRLRLLLPLQTLVCQLPPYRPVLGPQTRRIPAACPKEPR